jgi:hypothetical protein
VAVVADVDARDAARGEQEREGGGEASPGVVHDRLLEVRPPGGGRTVKGAVARFF